MTEVYFTAVSRKIIISSILIYYGFYLSRPLKNCFYCHSDPDLIGRGNLLTLNFTKDCFVPRLYLCRLTIRGRDPRNKGKEYIFKSILY